MRRELPLRSLGRAGARGLRDRNSGAANAGRKFRFGVMVPHASFIGLPDTGRLPGTYPASANPLSEWPTIHPEGHIPVTGLYGLFLIDAARAGIDSPARP